MELAVFIDAQDKIPIYLALSMYRNPIEYFGGYYIEPNTGSDRVRVWINETSVVIGCKGTNITSYQDLSDDLILAQGGKCSLSIVGEAISICKRFVDSKQIIVCGHSLGGAAAFCLAKSFPVHRAISLNGAAPPIGGPHLGAGANCIMYHIVGDVISTHAENCTVKRIHLPGDVDWFNVTFYHSSERFFQRGNFEYWSAQQEQDSLSQAIFYGTKTVGWYLAGVVSKRINPERLKEIICKQPIPGSKPSTDCEGLGKVPFTEYLNRGSVAAVGAFLGFLLGNPVVGAIAGYRLASGEGILDQLPEPPIFDLVKRAKKVYQRQIV